MTKNDVLAHRNTKLITPIIGLSISLILPSTSIVQKYFGLIGTFFYIFFSVFLLTFITKYIATKNLEFISSRQFFILTITTFVILFFLFIAIYPLANSGRLGKGSDRDEALNIAIEAMIEGHYPYYAKTYLNHPISPLPGSLLLASPFVLLGNSAYQNLFWLLLFLITTSIYFQNKNQALLLFITILINSPIVLQEFVTGGDMLANSIFVLLATLWTAQVTLKSTTSFGLKAVLALFLGITLSSRANFIFLVPLIFSFELLNVGLKQALVSLLFIGLGFIFMTLPFYVYDPAGFSPLHTASKLRQFQLILPNADYVILFLMGILTFLLSLLKSNRSINVLLFNCTAVLAFPVIMGTILQSIQSGFLNLDFTSFGLTYLFFGATVSWAKILLQQKRMTF